MTTVASGRLRAYLALGSVGLLAGLLLGRPEPVVLAAPFLLAIVIGLALSRPPELEVGIQLDRQRAVEGEEVELRVAVRARQPVAWLEVDVQTPRGMALRSIGGDASASLRAGRALTFHRLLECRRWGGRLVGRVQIEARDLFGFFHFRTVERSLPPLRVYPRAEVVRRLLRAADTQALAGNEVSRLRGEGIEFADVRPFVPGDRVRRVNWRITARSGQLHVNEMLPERNADVVLFLDTFSELRDAHGSSVDAAVRAAMGLSRAYLARRDRVGLIGFGGTLRWLHPEMGERQLYRIMDALIDTEVVLSYAWKGLEVIPRRTLPPKSLVIALTPLLDERSVGALLDLRGRGHDLAVVEISPLDYVEAGRRETERLAYRLWQLEREALRARFQALGVPAVTWPRGEPLQGALATADSFRRDTRVAHR